MPLELPPRSALHGDKQTLESRSGSYQQRHSHRDRSQHRSTRPRSRHNTRSVHRSYETTTSKTRHRSRSSSTHKKKARSADKSRRRSSVEKRRSPGEKKTPHEEPRQRRSPDEKKTPHEEREKTDDAPRPSKTDNNVDSSINVLVSKEALSASIWSEALYPSLHQHHLSMFTAVWDALEKTWKVATDASFAVTLHKTDTFRVFARPYNNPETLVDEPLNEFLTSLLAHQNQSTALLINEISFNCAREVAGNALRIGQEFEKQCFMEWVKTSLVSKSTVVSAFDFCYTLDGGEMQYVEDAVQFSAELSSFTNRPKGIFMFAHALCIWAHWPTRTVVEHLLDGEIPLEYLPRDLLQHECPSRSVILEWQTTATTKLLAHRHPFPKSPSRSPSPPASSQSRSPLRSPSPSVAPIKKPASMPRAALRPCVQFRPPPAIDEQVRDALDEKCGIVYAILDKRDAKVQFVQWKGDGFCVRRPYALSNANKNVRHLHEAFGEPHEAIPFFVVFPGEDKSGIVVAAVVSRTLPQGVVDKIQTRHSRQQPLTNLCLWLNDTLSTKGRASLSFCDSSERSFTCHMKIAHHRFSIKCVPDHTEAIFTKTEQKQLDEEVSLGNFVQRVEKLEKIKKIQTADKVWILGQESPLDLATLDFLANLVTAEDSVSAPPPFSRPIAPPSKQHMMFEDWIEQQFPAQQVFHAPLRVVWISATQHGMEILSLQKDMVHGKEFGDFCRELTITKNYVRGCWLGVGYNHMATTEPQVHLRCLRSFDSGICLPLGREPENNTEAAALDVWRMIANGL